MPSPPIQPRPRSWRESLTEGINPDYAALLASFDDPPEPSRSPTREPAAIDAASSNDDPLNVLGSPHKLPEIRATSPSPGRPGPSTARSDGSASPLPDPPSRAQIFDARGSTEGRTMVPEEGGSGVHTALCTWARSEMKSC